MIIPTKGIFYYPLQVTPLRLGFPIPCLVFEKLFESARLCKFAFARTLFYTCYTLLSFVENIVLNGKIL